MTIGSIPSSEAKTSFFRGLGDLPGGSFNSRAAGISANGTKVAASGSPEGYLRKTFIWDNTSKVVRLSGLDSLKKLATLNVPENISADGTFVVGHIMSTT